MGITKNQRDFFIFITYFFLGLSLIFVIIAIFAGLNINFSNDIFFYSYVIILIISFLLIIFLSHGGIKNITRSGFISGILGGIISLLIFIGQPLLLIIISALILFGLFGLFYFKFNTNNEKTSFYKKPSDEDWPVSEQETNK